MAFKLVVTNEFGEYKRGAQIVDAAKIAVVLDSSNEMNVVKVAIDPNTSLDPPVAKSQTVRSLS
jgi:hypothetical protein